MAQQNRFPQPNKGNSKVIETGIVHGNKLELCEVKPRTAHQYLNESSPKSRYFLRVNGKVDTRAAKKYFTATGEVRWDIFTDHRHGILQRMEKAKERINRAYEHKHKAQSAGSDFKRSYHQRNWKSYLKKFVGWYGCELL